MPIVIPSTHVRPGDFTIKIDKSDYNLGKANFEDKDIRATALQQLHYTEIVIPNDQPAPTRAAITGFLTIAVLSKMFGIPYPVPKTGANTYVTADGVMFTFAQDDNGKLFIIAAATTFDGLSVEEEFITNKDSGVVVGSSVERDMYAHRVKKNGCAAIRTTTLRSFLFNKAELFRLISNDAVPPAINDEHTRLYLMLGEEADTVRSYFSLGRTVGSDFVFAPPCPPICYY